MPLSIFIDALPYTEMSTAYKDWFPGMKLAELQPNIGYSSSLHWQLYCDKYPDERGAFVDWVKEKEPRRSVRFFSGALRVLDHLGDLGVISRKVLDRYVFRKHTFANVPYKFRGEFVEKGKYLFWNEKTYRQEEIFDSYTVISQDEGHLSMDAVMDKFDKALEGGEKNLFLVLGIIDSVGHICNRDEKYTESIRPHMDRVRDAVAKYLELHPDEEVLIVSDHGMSTVKNHVDLELEKRFGKQGKKTYIAYRDSAIMCIWAEDEDLRGRIAEYLASRPEGHLLTEEEREYYRVKDRTFGDLIYNLREGNVFKNNWFGKSLRKKPQGAGFGMHGFWPEREARDQMASIILINGKREIDGFYNYRSANRLIREVMNGGDKE